VSNEKKPPSQAAVIPVRRVDGEWQVCLIRRKDSARWGIPKGCIERGEDWRQAALTEAHEEAGLGGRVVGEMIGTYEYDKGPSRLTVAVCLMEVSDERTAWHEMRRRERRWCSIEEAGVLLKNHPVSSLYDRIQPRIAAMIS
jgi:8-oxo-dGTP pyrophosphatase MutT (NUDIX family)